MYNMIDSTAIIEADVIIGTGNYIGPYCHIYNGTRIGDNNRIEGYSSVGSPAEKRGFFLPEQGCGVVIGNSNIIREFTTINAGSRRVTQMGNHCTMLRGSHLSHDTIFEDNVTLSCTVMVGGESYVMTGANIGLGAVLHQFSVVGSYVMIGMGSVCTKTAQLKPGEIHVGNPARYLRANTIGLQRNLVSEDGLLEEIERWEKIRADNSK